jgi:hypothetical protein
MKISEPICYKRKCIHLKGMYMKENKNGPPSPIFTCTAFPHGEGIPGEIVFGDNLHLKPLKNQGNDIVYQKREEE